MNKKIERVSYSVESERLGVGHGRVLVDQNDFFALFDAFHHRDAVLLLLTLIEWSF
jgi:hypothetical protein